jgi:hypothetical protein
MAMAASAQLMWIEMMGVSCMLIAVVLDFRPMCHKHRQWHFLLKLSFAQQR